MATPNAPKTELGTEVAEHPKGGFPAFRSDTFAAQIVWLAISFGLLYYLMAKVALPRVQAVLEDRRVRIATDLDEAARARAESEAASAAYETSLADARSRSAALAKEAHDRLAADSAERRRTLEADLAAKLDAAERTLAGRKAEAMTHVDEIAAEASTAIVERLTGRAPDPAAIRTALAGAAR